MSFSILQCVRYDEEFHNALCTANEEHPEWSTKGGRNSSIIKSEHTSPFSPSKNRKRAATEDPDDSSSAVDPKGTPARKRNKGGKGYNPDPLPVEDLSEEDVKITSRGRRVRKDIDYRVYRPEIELP